MGKWPAPIVQLFVGELTPAALLTSADDPRPQTKQDRLCEANFYIGELSLLQSDWTEAERLFRLVESDCPKVFYEWSAARAELKSLAEGH
jgi:lipoprotein NlpI